MSASPSFCEPFPILYVNDVARSIRFYTESLGFEVSYKRRAEHEGRDFELCLYTDDADRAAEQLRDAGPDEVQPPQDEPWGERRTYFPDPDGNLVHIAQTL